MNIVLCGFKHSGKTTYGRQLAKLCQAHFIDTDDVLQQQYIKEGHPKMSVRNIHREIGEEAFRALEQRAIASIDVNDNIVVATGGGSILAPENIEHLKKIGVLVFLDVEPDILQERLLSHSIPSFLDKNDPIPGFKALLAERAPIYRQVCDVVLPIGHQPDTVIIDQLMQYRGHYGK